MKSTPLSPFKLLWSSFLYPPISKSRKSKAKKQDPTCFQNCTIRKQLKRQLHLFGWQALELNQTQPLSLESMTYEAFIHNPFEMCRCFDTPEICWPWFTVDVLCNTCIFPGPDLRLLKILLRYMYEWISNLLLAKETGMKHKKWRKNKPGNEK
jgi:hypothetical protein